VDDALTTHYNSQQPIEIPDDCKQAAAEMDDSKERIEIPDAAVDKHTHRGCHELKRKGAAGIAHFYDVATKLVNETTQPELQNQYKETARQASLKKANARKVAKMEAPSETKTPV
jgi:hypothetical protein